MDKEKICEVKKIVLKIEDKEISLSPEQAKKLKELLNDLFGQKVIKEEYHHHHNYPIWRYYEPVNPYPLQPKIWCQTSYSANTKSINCSL